MPKRPCIDDDRRGVWWKDKGADIEHGLNTADGSQFWTNPTDPLPILRFDWNQYFHWNFEFVLISFSQIVQRLIEAKWIHACGTNRRWSIILRNPLSGIFQGTSLFLCGPWLWQLPPPSSPSPQSLSLRWVWCDAVFRSVIFWSPCIIFDFRVSAIEKTCLCVVLSSDWGYNRALLECWCFPLK